MTTETKKRIVKICDFTDVAGNLLSQEVRYEPKDFKQRRPDGRGGWIWNLNGVQLVPYNLPQVSKASYSFIVEGPKDCESLKALGFVASTNPMGAGKNKWRPEYNQHFKDREIFIIGDNDKQGREHVLQVAKSLHGVAKNIKIVELQGLPESGDVSDWIEKRKADGKTKDEIKEELEGIAKAIPDWQPPTGPQVISQQEKSAADDPDSDQSEGVRGSGHILRMYEDSQLYHDDSGVPYILYNGRLERLEVKNRRLSASISFFYYREVGKAPGREAISQAIGVLEGRALYEGTQIEIFNRSGIKDGTIFCDLGKGRTVAVSAGKWEVVNNPPVFFHAFNHQHPQPEPLKGGALWRFFEFCNLPEESRLLIAVFIVASFIPRIARPVLCVIGSQGAGKSFFCGLLKTLIDPSASTLLSMPRKEEDIDLLLYRHHFLPLDNVSDLSGDLSDRLSSVITGAALEKRQLHTDMDIVLLRCNPVIVLNGIVPFIHRPDLLDRSVTITLERISAEKRQTESELWRQFNEERPSILGGIFDALAKAMEIYPTITLKSLPRLADFARWGFAIAEAFGSRGHEFLRALSENANLQTEELVEGNTLFASIMQRMGDEDFLSGTFKTIFEAFKETASPSPNDRSFPTSPRAFRKHLERIRIPLEDMGIIFKIGQKSRQGKLLEFSKKGSAPAETTNDTPETPRDDSGDIPF